MNLSRVLVNGLVLTLMMPAFAAETSFGTTEVFNVSRPSIYSSTDIEQIQTTQQFNSESRNRESVQFHSVRRENVANVGYSLEENSYLARNGNFLADNSLGRSAVAGDSRDGCPDGQVAQAVGSADDYDLNGCRTKPASNDYSKYVYYKQSVTVVNPNSPLYEGQTSSSVTASVTTGQQVANRNANQNALFFCTAGDRAQTAEAFKKVQNADLGVWKDLNDFDKCQAWTITPK